MTLMQATTSLADLEEGAAETERDLIERAKHDPQAFAILYRRHYRALHAYVYRRLGDAHVAEDVVAEVFLTALKTLPRFRYRGVPVRYWLLRIATNAVNQWVRRTRRRDALHRAVADQADAAEAAAGRGDIDGGRARSALLAISPKLQGAMALHYLEGLTVEDVASVIGCRVGTVKSRLARGRDALRLELNGRR